MIIPFEQLPPETLRNLIEDFVTRDGTDYGMHESSLESKVQHVKQALKTKQAVIVFDEETETCNLLPAEQVTESVPSPS